MNFFRIQIFSLSRRVEKIRGNTKSESLNRVQNETQTHNSRRQRPSDGSLLCIRPGVEASGILFARLLMFEWLKWLFQRYDELYDWPHSAGHSTGALGRSHSLAWPTSKRASERFIKVISGSHFVIKMDVERRGNHTRFIFSQGRFPLVAQFHQSAV